MINRDDIFRDKFRTGDAPIAGSVFYSLSLPDQEWFWAQVADALLSLTIPDNWEQSGTVSIDDAVEAASEVLLSFQSLVGSVFAVTWGTLPDSFLLCDGSTYLRVDYPALYAVLDPVFIIDADNFNVPNLSGRVIVGADATHVVGYMNGEEDHTLMISEIPSHDHSIPGTISSLAVQPGDLPVLDPFIVPGSTGSTGGDGPHNNMQPYQAIYYVIAAR